MFIFALGIVVEVVTRAWIDFPLSWLLICLLKLVDALRGNDRSVDDLFNILYYTFSVILLAVGIVFDFWLVSWTAMFLGLILCWILFKLKIVKSKPKIIGNEIDS